MIEIDEYWIRRGTDKEDTNRVIVHRGFNLRVCLILIVSSNDKD